MKILFIDTCHPVLINSLKKDGHDCVEGYDFSYEQILNEIRNSHGVVIRSRILLDKKILGEAKELIFIARAGAGMECIDVNYASGKNIACLNSPEGNMDAVGEHALGMLLSLMNNLNRADRQVRGGEWIREANRGHELQGKTVGIIGYGNMGSAFASKLKGFGCKVLAYDKYKKDFGNSDVRECRLQEIFNEADVLSIHVPLTSETEFFINSDFIGKFKKDFYFINTARGKCVMTDDLVKSLQSEKILGACLDVVEYEETSFERFSDGWKSNPSWYYLLNSDKVILTPHIAGWTFESHEKIAKVLYEKIRITIGNL